MKTTAPSARLARFSAFFLAAISCAGPLAKADPSFSPATFLPVSANPQIVVVADFDRDGFPDVATLSFSNNSVTINFGGGTRTASFSAAAAVGAPATMAAGDMDNDGRVDLVIGLTSGLVQIYRNTIGVQGATAPFTAAGGALDMGVTNITALQLADLNHDGKLDIAVADGSSAISVAVSSAATYNILQYSDPDGVQTPRDLAIGDLNGDGAPDIVTANTSGTVDVYLNNGDGTFDTAVQYATSTQSPRAIALGDVDGDGKLDVVTIGNDSTTNSVGSVNVMINDGNGVLGSPMIGQLSHAASRIGLADLLNTGGPQIVLVDTAANLVSVIQPAISTPMGSEVVTFGAAIDFAAGTSPAGLAIADFNRDGKLDVLTASSGSSQTTVLTNASADTSKGTYLFTSSVQYYPSGDAPIFGLVSADFNGDGLPDLAAADNFTGNVRVYLNQGAGQLPASPTLFPSAVGASFLASGDFNHDGKVDLVVSGTSDSTQVGAQILTDTSTGSFEPITVVDPATTLSSNPKIFGKVIVADFNRDGNLDLAFTGETSNMVTVLLGNGDGTFGLPATYAIGRNSGIAAAGDLNGDGFPDLVIPNFDDNTISILLNDGSGKFGTQTVLPASKGPHQAVIGDFNRDGKLDFATTNALGNTVSVFLGKGDGTFQAKHDFPGGPGALGITVGDFNRDGKLDVATANTATDSKGNATGGDISVLYGNGDGTFGAAVTFPTSSGSGPAQIVTADLNHDGQPDLVTANLNGGNLSVLLHASPGLTLLHPATKLLVYPDGSKTATSGHADKYWNFIATQTDDITLPILLRLEYSNDDATWTPLSSMVRSGKTNWVARVKNLPVGPSSFFRTVTYSMQPGFQASPGESVGDFPVQPAPANVILQVIAQPEADPNSTTVYPGQIITYTLYYRNIGGTPADQVTVAANVPAHMTFVDALSAGADIAHNSGKVSGLSWQVSEIPADGSLGTKSFRVQVDADVKPNSKIGGASSDFSVIRYPVGKSQARIITDDPELVVGYPLSVVVTADGDVSNVHPGDQVGIDLDCTNHSGTAINSVVLTEHLPPGTRFLGAGNNGQLTADGDVVWNIGTLNARSHITLFLLVEVQWDAELGSTILNGSPKPYNALNPPKVISYTSNTTITGVKPGSKTPTKPDFISHGPVDPDGNPVLFSFNIANQEPVNEPVIALTQEADADGIVHNSALGDVTTVVMPPSSGLPGQITLHFTCTNTGASTAHDVKLTGFRPAFTDFLPFSQPPNTPNYYLGADNNPQPIPQNAFATIDNIFALAIGDLTPGSSVRFSFKVQVRASEKPGEFLVCNGAYVTSSSFRKNFEVTPDTLNFQIVQPISFKHDATHLTKPVIAFSNPNETGDSAILIDFTNKGGVTSSKTGLSVPLPKGIAMTSVVFLTPDHVHSASHPQAGSVDTPRSTTAATGSSITRINIDDVAPGESRSVAVNIHVSPGTTFPKSLAGSEVAIQGRFVRTLHAAAQGFETRSANFAGTSGTQSGLSDVFTSTAVLSVFQQKPAHLWIGKKALSTVHPGDTITYDLLFGNSGDASAPGVVVGMQIPSGTKLVPGSVSGVTIVSPGQAGSVLPSSAPAPKGGILTWQVGALAGHAAGGVRFQVTVNQGFSDCAVTDNSAYISSSAGIPPAIPGPIGTHIRDKNFLTAIWENVGCFFAGIGSDISNILKNSGASQDVVSLQDGAETETYGGVDLAVVRSNHGAESSVVIANGGGQVVVSGGNNVVSNDGGSVVSNDGGTVISHDGGTLVAAGPGTGLTLKAVDGSSGGNLLISNLLANVDQIILNGGGNLIAAGGGNIIHSDGAGLISNIDGSILRPIGPNIANFVEIKGGNYYAAGVGNIAAAGNGNSLGGTSDLAAASFGRVSAMSGNKLVTAAPGAIISNNPDNIVSEYGNGLISEKGSGIIHSDGAGVIAKETETVVAQP